MIHSAKSVQSAEGASGTRRSEHVSENLIFVSQHSYENGSC